MQSAQASGGLVPAPVSQRYGINAPAGTGSAKDRSGDADLPQRVPLSDRRALLDSVSQMHFRLSTSRAAYDSLSQRGYVIHSCAGLRS